MFDALAAHRQGFNLQDNSYGYSPSMAPMHASGSEREDGDIVPEVRPQGKVCQAKAPLKISTVCRPKAAALQPPKTLQLDNDGAKAAAPNSLKDLQEDEENEEVEEDFLIKVVDTKVVKVPNEDDSGSASGVQEEENGAVGQAG